MKLKSVLFCLLCITLVDVAIAQSNTISGTLSLPSGVTAVGTGATFKVKTFPTDIFQDAQGFFHISSTTITIPAGLSSAPYSIVLDDASAYPNKRIEFNCESGCENLDVTTSGYWSSVDGVVEHFSATEYDGTQSPTVNILLETADTFSGVVNFPVGLVATGDEQIVLRIKSADLFPYVSFTFYIYPEAGESQWPFVFGVPSDETSSGWELYVKCNIDCSTDISDEDHYPTTIGGEPMTLDETQQYIFPKNQDYSSISLTFNDLRVPSTGYDAIMAPIYLLLDDDSE